MLARAFSLLLPFWGAASVMAGPQEGKPAAPSETAQSPVPVPAAGQPEGEKETDPLPQAAPEDLPNRDAILKQLSHEAYKERVAAQEALLQWGENNLERGIDLLYRAYQDSDDPEIRLRSREVLKRLVMIKQPFEGSGYLGIQMDSGLWKNEAGGMQPAVRITVVREGTAAELAKLQVNDLVTGVDEVVFGGAEPTIMFSDYIQSKRPGDVITLHVQRGEETLKIKASLRRRSPLLNRFSQWGTLLELPPQSELDESDFQEWLGERASEEQKAAKGGK